MVEFEETLAQTIHRILFELFGATAGAALETRLNPSLANSDPMAYASMLESLVGTNPADVILRRMEDAICVKFGLGKRKWQSFSECVEAARDAGGNA
jgi:hypothetical protein